MINIGSICCHKYLRLSYLKKIRFIFIHCLVYILLYTDKNENFLKSLSHRFQKRKRLNRLTSSVAIRKEKNISKSAPSLKLISMPLFPLTNLKQCPKENQNLITEFCSCSFYFGRVSNSRDRTMYQTTLFSNSITNFVEMSGVEICEIWSGLF